MNLKTLCKIGGFIALASLAWSVGIADVLEDRPSLSEGDIEFYLDTAGFLAMKGQTYEEVYFRLLCDQLSFLPKGEGIGEALFTVAVVVDDMEGKPIRDRRWTRRVQADSVEQKSGAVLDLFPFTLPPGDYRLTVRVKDTYSGKEGICRRTLFVQSFDVDGLAISEIQFGSNIQSTDSEGKFVKNRQRITPNLTRSFSTQDAALYCYVEIYNLAEGGPDTDSFDLAYTILDSSGHVARRYPIRRIRKPGSSGVKGEKLNISGLSEGGYTLQIVAKDHLNGQTATAERQFQVISPVRVVSITKEDFEEYYHQIKYIATEEELRMYKTLAPEAKLRFLVTFWKKQDPTPRTAENEFVVEHLRRIRDADDRFGGRVSGRGSDTDRGRIYIKYGPPDDIRPFTMMSEEKSYEIWTYETRGYYEFVFRDRRGFGIYELVHSTMPGERYNPDWQDEP